MLSLINFVLLRLFIIPFSKPRSDLPAENTPIFLIFFSY